MKNQRITCIYPHLVVLLLLNLFHATNCDSNQDELLDKEYGVKYANPCEACKYLTIELQDRFEKLGQTSAVIEVGYGLDGPKKRTNYTRSEVYYIEALENVCDKLLEYNIHKERKDSTRFAKGMSSTFKTLHKLVDKGVKVDLGIPEELWDSPSAEITALKQQCEQLLEKHEDLIEQWYWGTRDQHLQQYLCRDRILQKEQRACLDDPAPPQAEDPDYVPKRKDELTSDHVNSEAKSQDDTQAEQPPEAPTESRSDL